MASREELTEADEEIDRLESRHDHGSQDEESGKTLSLGDHVKAESESEPKNDRVLEFVVKTLQEAVTMQMEGYRFCDIIAILGYHNHSLYEESKEPEYVRVSLYLAMAAVATMPHNHIKLFMIIGVLTDVLKSKYELYGNMKDLLRAIQISEEAIEQALPEDEGRTGFLSALSALYEMKYGKSFDVEALEWAVYYGEEAVASVPFEHQEYGLHQHNLGDKLSSLYKRTGVKEYLDRAMVAAHKAVEATPMDHQNRPGYLNNLANCMSQVATLSGLRTDAEEALRLAQAVVDTASKDDWRYPRYLTNLGNRYSEMYKFSRNDKDLDESVKFGRLTLVQEAGNDTISQRLPGHMSNLAIALFHRYRRTQSRDDFEEAISLQHRALELLPQNPHAERAMILGNLSRFLEDEYESSRDIEHLEEAIKCARAAVDSSLTGSPNQGDHLETLSRLLVRRFKHNHDLRDLDEAEQEAKKAVLAPVYEGSDEKSRWVVFSNLATTIASNFSLERTLTTDQVDRAYSMAKRAIEELPAQNSRRPLLLNNLAYVLQYRFRRSSSQGDLDTAIALVQEGLDSIGPANVNRAMLLSNLSLYLGLKYEYSGFRSQLEDSVALAEEALAVAKLGDLSDPTRYYTALAIASASRFEKFGDLKDLERAVSISEAAVTATPPGKQGKLAKMRHNASVQLGKKVRSGRGTSADLERAVGLAQQVIEATPEGHYHLGKYRSALADLYALRFDMKGEMADLDCAIGLTEQVLASLPVGHLKRSLCLEDLSRYYEWKFEAENRVQSLKPTSHAGKVSKEEAATSAGDLLDGCNLSATDYLDKAIESSVKSVDACSEDSWDRARLLNHVGDLLRQRVSFSQSDDDIEDCLRSYDRALKTDLAAPRDRIAAARSAASVCMQAGAITKASEILNEAMRILPQIHTRASERGDEYDQAADFRNLASDAAAVALRAGKTAYEALSLLESGNAVIIGTTIDYRSDVSDLHATHPEIAEDFDRTRREIDSPANGPNRNDPSRDVLTDRYGPIAKKRRMAAGHLEELLSTIRRLPGHEKFLLPPAESHLLQLASSGPIVILNSSFMAARADAIIVTSESIRSLYLEKATRRGFYQPSREAMNLRTDAEEFALETGVLKGGLRTRAKRNSRMRTILKYSWETFLEPVCSFLEAELKTDSDHLLHVCWIRFGLPFNQIPIHAIGDGTKASRASVYSRVISSYAPSIKALIYAREREFTFLSTPSPHLLVATMETTPGIFNWLPGINDEVTAIKKIMEDQVKITHLTQPEAQVVHKEMSKAQAAHFACHGSSDMLDPSNSSLIFTKTNQDGNEEPDPLRVRDISLSNHSAGTDMQLAYLSACSGASNDIQALADESIHMGSSFLLAGFSHVIATLWEVQDGVCVDIAREFYKHLLIGREMSEGSMQRHQRVSRALHKALEPVRRTYWDEPLVWAPFIHMGA